MSAQIIPAQFDTELVNGNLKAAMKEAKARSSDLWKVPRESIRVMPGFNVRVEGDPEYQKHLRWITDSIKENGFYEDKPLSGYVAREGGIDFIYITDGHSRLKAVDIAINEGCEFGSLPIVVKPRGTSLEDLTVALVTSNGGKPLTPFEMALVCKRLVGYGMEDATIAKRLGITKRYLDNLLLLAGAPASVRDKVIAGSVSATLAIDVLKAHGEKAGERLSTALNSVKGLPKPRITKKHLAAPGADKEIAKARREQTATVMDRIGPLLDGWNLVPYEARELIKEQSPALAFNLDAINAAMNHSEGP